MIPPDFWYFLVSGFLLMLCPVFLIAFWQRGFFGAWYKTKISANKKVLLRIRSRLRDYYSSGFIKDGALTFKDSTKAQRTIIVPRNTEVFYRSFGVVCVDVDEERNCLFKLDGSGVTGFDAEKFDDIIQKALQKPSALDRKILIVLICVIVGLLLSLFSIYFTYQNNKMLKYLVVAASKAAPTIVAGG